MEEGIKNEKKEERSDEKTYNVVINDAHSHSSTEAEEEKAEMNEKGTIPLNVNDDARNITNDVTVSFTDLYPDIRRIISRNLFLAANTTSISLMWKDMEEEFWLNFDVEKDGARSSF